MSPHARVIQSDSTRYHSTARLSGIVLFGDLAVMDGPWEVNKSYFTCLREESGVSVAGPLSRPPPAIHGLALRVYRILRYAPVDDDPSGRRPFA